MKAGTYDVLRWAETQTCGGPGPKAVLMALARMAGLQSDGRRWACFPSQALLAEITEQSVRTVRSQLAALEAKGMIVREKRARQGPDGGRGRTTDLTFLAYLPADAAAGSADLAASHDRPTGKPRPTYRQPVAARNYQGTTSEEPELLAQPPARLAVAGSTYPDAFLQFWALYPRRTSKGDALRVWPSALRKAPLDAILEGVERSVRRWDAERRTAKHVPYPATWLRAEGWLDEEGPVDRGRAAALDVLGPAPSRGAAPMRHPSALQVGP